MSLGQWFRDYVYIPLGGNRKGTKRWLLNIFIVWMLTGLWHGAYYNFVLWGIYFGLILLIEKLYIYEKLSKLPNFVQHFYVLFLVSMSWVLFEVMNVNDIFIYIKSMIINANIIDSTFTYLFISNLFIIVFSILSATPIFEKYISNKLIKKSIVLIGFIISICFLIDASFNPFLYFRF